MKRKCIPSTATKIHLNKGVNKLTIYFKTGGFDLKSLKLKN